jgi:hypothetical protein
MYMKAMYKNELARLAGVSYRTFSRWLSRHQSELQEMGIPSGARLLPPKAVKFICDNYGIDLDEEM